MKWAGDVLIATGMITEYGFNAILKGETEGLSGMLQTNIATKNMKVNI